jgi:phosphoglycolate phosphatase-like HAD superfamily hydrolase
LTVAAVLVDLDGTLLDHRRSAVEALVTIEAMAGDETILGGGRFETTVEDYGSMRGIRKVRKSNEGPGRASRCAGGAN